MPEVANDPERMGCAGVGGDGVGGGETTGGVMMKKEIKRWVKFLSPGLLVAEDWTRDIKHLDPARIKWPSEAYAFELYEREDMVDGETRYKGEPKRIGPTYYHPDSKIETLKQVRANPKNKDTCLVSNMECNGWKSIVWSRWGNWPQPFDAKKMVVLPPNKETP